MGCFVPDFEHLYLDKRFSDVEIEIVEDCSGLGQKRNKGWTMPGHSTVLMGFSSYCKVKLENWTTEVSNNVRHSGSGSGPCLAKYTIQLPVPTGQKDVAARLIAGMYQKCPRVSDLSQQQLLQLLLLADKFEVPKVQAAVFSAFKALSMDQLHWDIALALLDLPFKCDETTQRIVLSTAETKLLQQLGDLEKVWADEQLQKQLLQLPQAALLHLLQHDDTRVASESTVVYTILQWWQKQPKSYRSSHMQRLKELMQQVRMQHLSLLYLNTFMMNNETVLSCYSMHELAVACSCTDPCSKEALQKAMRPQLQQNPAWTADKRPASKVQQVVEWKPPIAVLRNAAEKTLSSRRAQATYGPVRIIQGQTVQLLAEWRTVADATAAGNGSSSGVKLQLGLFLDLCYLDREAVRNVTMKLWLETAVTAANGRPRKNLCCGPVTCAFCSDGVGHGFTVITTCDCVSSWSDVEAKLIQDELVHADGCLHCKVEIMEMA